MAHILVVDDDQHIVDVICFALEKAGHSFDTAADGQSALDIFSDSTHEMIILDVGMPEIDGLEVCRRIRKSSEVPILFLSARDEEIDRVLGLEIGGDDYVTKPFSPRELIARISVILKRTSTVKQAPETETLLIKGQLELDPAHRSARFSSQALKLTALEFNLLYTILARPRMAFTREQLLNSAWPDNIHVSDRTIDSHIRNLRAKLLEVGCQDAIETVHGIGFRLGSCE
ncbi:MAG: response regulator transcription factor [Pseudomonadota bacterium]